MNTLAELTEETKTQAVTRARYDRLEVERRKGSDRGLANELDAIARHCASLPVLDDRSEGEILGYDDSGVPR
ncbi:type II toxin-antitoxin system VapB family antitoxin [Candidatus Thiosymbion oneisti]|uniref:type II toxin-antitoxin system VapB family antitoxin n=1 Tax=Candidatus Thiosymbion oneisti TaxID=589554 RepID=UPI00105F4250|nr:type II toxin-antitoxin system VapB family antitoxin [Candidatus Thiosymbion oneisti]